MSRSLKFALFSTAFFLFILILIFGFYAWFLGKQRRVEAGTARATFPYSDYSIEELNKLYPQYLNVDVATTRTPVETHKMFVEKLKANDLDGAVECCFAKGDWAEMKAGLERVKAKGEMGMMVGDLDREIKGNFIGDTLASYDYFVERDGKNVAGVISFEKNSEGIWLIKSL
ncbi:MAG: hypothetical protein A3J93_01250 [Candidatus Magasanikbacteria bacterium RIFOXYC2_FULL_42_28]|uniref:Uncharacterized protein n=1 Tax=Candidatus Magasanikbacteria bacterium RIFOXYC2_FULL_42_28 TaxID=1798704 RepID=A0A1F6NXR8_9BACT|nr:MAG: hypothetical protein A3J93_01250 [Candidatus Magasanikbacteria bacterium RIFOXYC2_FULL_42_28]